MNEFVQFLLMAAPGGTGGAEGAQGGSALYTFLPFIAIIAIFYFLIIRPQSKKQKETQKMLAALKKGDRIVTIGGIHGTIHKVMEQSVIVKVDENTRLEFNRSAISAIVAAARERDDDDDEDSAAEDEKK
jgi:preprotein translocase subunit YajC